MPKRIFVLTEIHICTHIHYVARKPKATAMPGLVIPRLSQHGAGNGLWPCNMAGLLPVLSSTFASFYSLSCSVPHVLVSHCNGYLVFFFWFCSFRFFSFPFSFFSFLLPVLISFPPPGRLGRRPGAAVTEASKPRRRFILSYVIIINAMPLALFGVRCLYLVSSTVETAP